MTAWKPDVPQANETIEELWSARDAEALKVLRRTLHAHARPDAAGWAAGRGGSLFDALVAIDGCSDAETKGVLRQLGDWASQVRLSAGTGAPWQLLSRTLRDGAGFRGDPMGYSDPDNYRLSRVVSRRRGQPLVMTAIWVIVGQLAGLDVEAIALPGHFVARAEGSLMDPFSGGNSVSTSDCARIAKGYGHDRPWDGDVPRAADVPSMAKRALRGLSRSYGSQKNRRGVYRSTRMLTKISSADPAPLLRLAQLSEEFGAYREAARLYRELTESFEDTREARIAEIRGLAVIARSRTLN